MTYSLRIKDIISTALAAVVGWIAYAQISGISIPFISSYRWATLLVGILGIGMCAFGSNLSSTSGMNGLQKLLSGLGIASFFVIIAGLIFGTKLIFLTLVGIILLLWLLTMVRHVLG